MLKDIALFVLGTIISLFLMCVHPFIGIMAALFAPLILIYIFGDTFRA